MVYFSLEETMNEMRELIKMAVRYLLDLCVLYVLYMLYMCVGCVLGVCWVCVGCFAFKKSLTISAFRLVNKTDVYLASLLC